MYRKHRPKHGDTNVACLFQELPFANESFDRATASFSLVKLREGSERALAEIFRVLKPGGILQVYPVDVKHKSKATELEEAGLVKRNTPFESNYKNYSAAGGAIGLVESALADAAGAYVNPVESLGGFMVVSGIGALAINAADVLLRSATLSVEKYPELNDPTEGSRFARTLLDAYAINSPFGRER